MPRPIVPHQIQLLDVPRGASAGSSAGDYLKADSLISARVTGDDAPLFSVVKLETFDVEFDPDVGQDVLVFATAVPGAGPIQGSQGEAILATVEFACPVDPQKTKFHATALLEGPGL